MESERYRILERRVLGVPPYFILLDMITGEEILKDTLEEIADALKERENANA